MLSISKNNENGSWNIEPFEVRSPISIKAPLSARQSVSVNKFTIPKCDQLDSKTLDDLREPWGFWADSNGAIETMLYSELKEMEQKKLQEYNLPACSAMVNGNLDI